MGDHLKTDEMRQESAETERVKEAADSGRNPVQTEDVLPDKVESQPVDVVEESDPQPVVPKPEDSKPKKAEIGKLTKQNLENIQGSRDFSTERVEQEKIAMLDENSQKD